MFQILLKASLGGRPPLRQLAPGARVIFSSKRSAGARHRFSAAHNTQNGAARIDNTIVFFCSTNPITCTFFWSFLTKTEQNQALPSQAHVKIWPHSAQFWLWFFSISTYFWDTLKMLEYQYKAQAKQAPALECLSTAEEKYQQIGAFSAAAGSQPDLHHFPLMSRQVWRLLCRVCEQFNLLTMFFGRHFFDEFHLAGTSQQALFGRHCFGTFHRKGRVWLKSASR